MQPGSGGFIPASDPTPTAVGSSTERRRDQARRIAIPYFGIQSYFASYRGIFVVAIALSSVVGGYRWGHSRLVTPLAGEGLSIASEYQDFGAAILQEDFVWKAPIQNNSSAPIEVVGFERSCGCASILPTQFTLGPGETRWLDIHLNLRSHDAFTFSGEQREFSVTLRPLIAKSMTPGAPAVLQGKIQSPYRLVDSQLRFAPNALIAGQQYEPLVFTLSPQLPVQNLTVEVAAESAAAQVFVEPEGDHSRISLRPDASLAPGVHDFRLEIAATQRNGGGLPKQTLRLTGRVLQDVAVEPAYLRFHGASTSAADVQLTSRTATPFQVVRIESVNESLRVERSGGQAAPSTHAQFDVQVVAPPPELAVSQIVFHVRSDNPRAGEFSVPLQVVLQPEAVP